MKRTKKDNYIIGMSAAVRSENIGRFRRRDISGRGASGSGGTLSGGVDLYEDGRRLFRRCFFYYILLAWSDCLFTACGVPVGCLSGCVASVAVWAVLSVCGAWYASGVVS